MFAGTTPAFYQGIAQQLDGTIFEGVISTFDLQYFIKIKLRYKLVSKIALN